MPVFRVHLTSGEKLDLVATTAVDASNQAKSMRPGSCVSKVKRLKDQSK